MSEAMTGARRVSPGRVLAITAGLVLALGLLLLLGYALVLIPRCLGFRGAHLASDAQRMLGLLLVPLGGAAVVLLVALRVDRARARPVRATLGAGLLATVAVAAASLVAIVTPALAPQLWIPAGSQQVRVSVQGDRLVATPTSVTQGQVYLVIDPSAEGVVFVGSSDGAGSAEGFGPMSEAALEAAAAGHLSRTAMASDLGGVFDIMLAPGRYLIASDDPARLADQGGGRAPAGRLVVLEVQPASP